MTSNLAALQEHKGKIVSWAFKGRKKVVAVMGVCLMMDLWLTTQPLK